MYTKAIVLISLDDNNVQTITTGDYHSKNDVNRIYSCSKEINVNDATKKQ